MNFNRFVNLWIFLGIFAVNPSLLLGTSASEKISTKETAEWLAFGDLRGHLEPCGCDPKSDLGSVLRLDAYIKRERMLHPNLRLFDLGNNFINKTNDLAKRKDAAIAEALKVISPTASLLNVQEIARLKSGLPSLPYVVSNWTEALPNGVKESVVQGDERIFGFVEPSGSEKRLTQNVDEWLKKIKLQLGTQNTLLFSGGKATLKKLAESKVFSTIISSNTWPFGKDFGDEERRDESRLSGYRGNSLEVLMVPVGGQGVIRSPSLQFVAPAMPVSALLEKPLTAKPAASKELSFLGGGTPTSSGLNSKRNIVKWLDPSEQTGMSQEILAVMDTYRNASSSAMQDLIKSRSADLASSNFVGAEACQTCHADSFKKWQDSKHAHAFTTIKAGSRDSDPECVSCHVVGFSAKGGFVSESLSPKLANVQCESCHGPRKQHIQNPNVKVVSQVKAKEACAQCHTPPHSPRFNFKEYWQQISHK